MDSTAFRNAYNESRNGASEFYHYTFDRSFHYSDGVRDCAIAGCYWILDIAATEFPAIIRKRGRSRAILEVLVGENQSCFMKLTVADDQPVIWNRTIGYTDMPSGTWYFELVDEIVCIVMTLLSEH